jgi:hypothetical protein
MPNAKKLSIDSQSFQNCFQPIAKSYENPNKML